MVHGHSSPPRIPCGIPGPWSRLPRGTEGKAEHGQDRMLTPPSWQRHHSSAGRLVCGRQRDLPLWPASMVLGSVGRRKLYRRQRGNHGPSSSCPLIFVSGPSGRGGAHARGYASLHADGTRSAALLQDRYDHGRADPLCVGPLNQSNHGRVAARFCPAKSTITIAEAGGLNRGVA